MCLTYIVGPISLAGAEVRLAGLELPLGFSLLYLSHVANPTGLFVSPLGDVKISWKADCLLVLLLQMGKQTETEKVTSQVP